MLIRRLGLKPPSNRPMPSAGSAHTWPAQFCEQVLDDMPSGHTTGPSGDASGLSGCVAPVKMLSSVRAKYPGGACAQLPPLTKVRPPKSWSVIALLRKTNHCGRSQTLPKLGPARLNEVVKRSIRVVTQ